MQSYKFTESLHPDDRDRVRIARRRHIDHGAALREECRMQRADGSYVWVVLRGESVRGSSGRTTRLVFSIVDDTERRAAQHRLSESERRYRALVEASPSLIWICDRYARLTFVSDRACRDLYRLRAARDARPLRVGLQCARVHAPRIPASVFAGDARQACVRHGSDPAHQARRAAVREHQRFADVERCRRNRIGHRDLQRHHRIETARARAQHRVAQPAGGVRCRRRRHRVRSPRTYRRAERRAGSHARRDARIIDRTARGRHPGQSRRLGNHRARHQRGRRQGRRGDSRSDAARAGWTHDLVPADVASGRRSAIRESWC